MTLDRLHSRLLFSRSYIFFLSLVLLPTNLTPFSVEMPSVLLMAAIRNVQIVSLYPWFFSEVVHLSITIPDLQMT